MIKTDGWKRYCPSQKDRTIEKQLREKGKGFPKLPVHIMNIKGWLM